MKRSSLLKRTLILGITACSFSFCVSGLTPLFAGAPNQGSSAHTFFMSGPIQEEIIAGVTLAPNPADTYTNVTVTLNSATNMTVSVVNMMGVTVMNYGTAYYNAGSHLVSLDIKDLSPGLYLVVCEANGQTMSKRLTVF
ncbi:MAG: T9SS type A sorting domain-containing protein [Chitinophagales bacterium]